MAAAWFNAMYPEKQVTFLNRGVSGDRVKDLKARWQEDCIDLKPTWVSIMIGINDCWRRYSQNDPTPVEQYAADYRFLLDKVKAETGAKLILCEPFVLPVPDDRKQWREDLDPKINAVREMAREYDALLVTFDALFAQAATKADPAYWAADGVHPSLAGHALMAQAWLERVRAV